MMRPFINIQCIPTPIMWVAAAAPGGDTVLTDEADQALTDEAGQALAQDPGPSN